MRLRYLELIKINSVEYLTRVLRVLYVAPVILEQSYCHRPLAPAILGQSITVSTRNSKVLYTPFNRQGF